MDGFKEVQQFKVALKDPDSLHSSVPVTLDVSAFHSDICQLRVQSWLAKTSGVMFSHWHPSKEEKAEAQVLSFVFIQEGRPSIDFPLDFTDRTGSLVYL